LLLNPPCLGGPLLLLNAINPPGFIYAFLTLI